MSYSSETYNRYKSIVDSSGAAVIRSIMYLLRPNGDYPVISDEVLYDRYKQWQSDCRAMDAACEQTWHSSRQGPLIMPPNDADHVACRRMAAVLIERDIYDEFVARESLADAVEIVRENLVICAKHPRSCACRADGNRYNNRWSYANKTLVDDLYHELESHASYQAPVASVSGAAMPVAKPVAKEVDIHDMAKCACGACYNERMKNGTSDAYMAWCQAESNKVLDELMLKSNIARNPAPNPAPNPSPISDDMIKDLFKVVQGVNYDDKCPHGIPFYACMSCSH